MHGVARAPPHPWACCGQHGGRQAPCPTTWAQSAADRALQPVQVGGRLFSCTTMLQRGSLLTPALLRRCSRVAAAVRCFSQPSQSFEELETCNTIAEATAQPSLQGSLLKRYESLVADGTLRPDVHQEACVLRLDKLCGELASYKAAVAAYQVDLAVYERARQERWQEAYDSEDRRLGSAAQHAQQGQQGSSSTSTSSIFSFFGGSTGSTNAAPDRHEGQQAQLGQLSASQRRAIVSARAERRLDELLGPPPPPPPAPKGVYIHGSVGSGKSLLMDLLYTTVAQPHSHTYDHPAQAAPGPARSLLPYHRRLHFNSALLELHSRLHELDRHREDEERRQMEAYAAAQAQAAEAAKAGGGLSAAWQQIRDPIADKLKRSKLAKLAYRRMIRDKEKRTIEEHSQALAETNASVLRHAARALIRNCDTLGLMQQSTRGSAPSVQSLPSTENSTPSARSAAGSMEEGDEVEEMEGTGGQGVPGEQEAGADASGRVAALLCFDEMQANDAFNIVALKGLMESLMDEGCVVVATSNRAPWELNRHGLHEDIFNHYIERLLASCDVVQLDAEQDYRRLLGGPQLLAPAAAAAEPAEVAGAMRPGSTSQHKQHSYFYPLGSRSAAGMAAEWQRVPMRVSASGANSKGSGAANSAGQEGSSQLRVMFGRSLEVRRRRGGAAWFGFEELCGRPLGAADYIALSQEFHTVFIEGVPAMSMKLRDRARRFITLLDELYNHRVRLVCSAEVPPDELFVGEPGEEPIIDLESLQFETAVEGSKLRRNLMADGGVAPVASSPQAAAAAAAALGGAEERFAFARAVSRLYEMQSPLYLHSRPRS